MLDIFLGRKDFIIWIKFCFIISFTIELYNIKIKFMYTLIQEQFETLKNTCKTENYHIVTHVNDNQLEIQLTLIKKSSAFQEPRKFANKISFENLDVALKEKFQNIKNLQAFLIDSNNLNVNLDNGNIELIMSISLLNGKSITTKLGQIKLKEVLYDQQRYLSEIFIMCHSKKELTDNNYKYIFREFVNMFRVLFKKAKSNDQKIAHPPLNFGGSPIKQLYSSLKDKNKYDDYGIQSKRRNSNNLYYEKNDRRMSLNKQWDFMRNPSDNNIRVIHNANEEVDRQELDLWKKQINKKVSIISEKNQQKYAQIEQKIKDIKKQLKAQISALKKQNQIDNMLKSTFINRPNPINSRLLNQQVNEKSLQNKIQKLDEQIKQLKLQYNQFSHVIVKKMENLGQKNQIFEDKVKRVMEQIDLRVQKRIIQQSSSQIRNMLIDTTSSFFQHFELNGTQIKYKGEDSESTILLGKIKMSERNCFSIKLVKTLVSNIQIGIVDAEYRNKRDCWTLPNFILYVGWNSTIYEGPNDMVLKQGEALNEGEILSVRTNTETGLIEWIVGGKVRAKVVWDKLKDKNINWVPMIRFYDHGDVISWMTDKMYKL